MIGKFIGLDSNGFKNGFVYKLEYEIKKIYDTLCICLYDKNSEAHCLYRNLNSITNNWQIISD